MQSQYIALVPEAGGVSPSELLRVSAALQKQISSQFGPIWELQATVDAFAELEDVPAGYRPIVLSPADLAGIAPGIHLDENSQAYARLPLAPGWSIAASRVCMEMLVNPFGQRTLSAASPRTDQGPAEVLVEVCGAFGDAPRAYAVNDVPVSDFCTPAFFDALVLRGGERYSFRGGAFTAPLQVLRGGHLAWFDAITNSWWLRTFNEEHPSDLSLGSLRPSSRTVRSLVMAHAPMRALSAHHHEPLDARVGLSWLREQASMAARARAEHLRVLLSGALGAADGVVFNAPVELPASAMASPSFGRLRAVEAPRPVREPTRNFEHELRDMVASQIDAAARQDVDAADEREITASQLLESERAVEAPAPSATILPPRDTLVGHSVKTVEAAKVAVAARPAAREHGSSTKSTKSASNASQGNATSTRQSTPPPLPGLPSSIAPVAMLDSARRSEGSRLGMMLIGAAAVALAVAGFMRGGDAKSSTQPVAASAPQPAQIPPAPATSPAPSAPAAPAPAAPIAPAVASPVAPVVPAASAIPQAPATAAVQKPSKADTSAKSAARDATSEKHERRRASKESAATSETDNATPKAQPVAAIESLFDTRR
jgi:hypothetical protein